MQKNILAAPRAFYNKDLWVTLECCLQKKNASGNYKGLLKMQFLSNELCIA